MVTPCCICKVYPRTYGGTFRRYLDLFLAQGLSPHVRGNPRSFSPRGARRGSIPARTGEPTCDARLTIVSGVYPRTYGGTVRMLITQVEDQGLSPHVRGNPLHVVKRVVTDGSIPARTGEPTSSSQTAPASGVYPRTYGGTIRLVEQRYASHGLSPHVRGNPTRLTTSGNF